MTFHRYKVFQSQNSPVLKFRVSFIAAMQPTHVVYSGSYSLSFSFCLTLTHNRLVATQFMQWCQTIIYISVVKQPSLGRGEFLQCSFLVTLLFIDPQTNAYHQYLAVYTANKQSVWNFLTKTDNHWLLSPYFPESITQWPWKIILT